MRRRHWISAALCAAAVWALPAAAADPPRELRVCADPDNFPFSNDKLEGFENKIADVIARDMGAAVHYTWHPQRGAFFRRTLKANLCDVVIGVPSELDEVLPTSPYYRSTYVFVSAKDKKLGLRSLDDPALKKARIGVHSVGDDGVNLPPVHALARRGLSRNLVGFTILHTNDSPPGRMIEAAAAGEIDVAVEWGPMAGYFAKRSPVPLEVTPVSPAVDGPLRFTFDISMGVRPGDLKLKDELERSLSRRRVEIQKILADFGVPLVEDAATADRSQRN